MAVLHPGQCVLCARGNFSLQSQMIWYLCSAVTTPPHPPQVVDPVYAKDNLYLEGRGLPLLPSIF